MSNKNKVPAGNIQVSCHHCHWNGRFRDLEVGYCSNPLLPGDVIPEIACPSCHQPDQIEFRDSLWQRLRLLIRPHKPKRYDASILVDIHLLSRRHTRICRIAKSELTALMLAGCEELDRIGDSYARATDTDSTTSPSGT